MAKPRARLIALCIILLTLVGIIIRINGTLSGYFAFTFDQGRDFLALYDLVYKKEIHLIGPASGVDGVFHGVWWYWFLAPIYGLCQGSPTCVISLFGVFQSFIIPLSYLLGKEIKDRKMGAIFALLSTFSPFFIGTAAQLWNPNLTPLLTIAFLLLFTRSFSNKPVAFIGAFWILGLLFELGIGYGLLFLPALLLTIYLTGHAPSLKTGFLAVCSFSFWLLPRTIFELRNGFVQSRSLLLSITTQKTTHDTLLMRLIQRWQTVFFQFKDAFALGNKWLAYILLLLCCVSLFFLARKSSSRVRELLQFVLVLVFMLLMVASVYSNVVWNYYFIGVPALLLPPVGFGFYWLITKQQRLGLLALISISSYHLLSFLFPGQVPVDQSIYKYQQAVVETVYQRAGDRPFNVQVYTPPVIDYTYHYLFLWTGTHRYQYVPPRDRIENLVYLIVEPDEEHPVLREAWLRDRAGDGQITWKKFFPGNISVEERDRIDADK